jgi:hypothetical protein
VVQRDHQQFPVKPLLICNLIVNVIKRFVHLFEAILLFFHRFVKRIQSHEEEHDQNYGTKNDQERHI